MSERADIVVVGGGGSALAAAVEAASLGCSVILLEKNAELGGTTALSVGSLMAAGSRLQKKAGIDDSADRHEAEIVKLLTRFPGNDNPVLRRLLVENSGATVDFLAAAGVDMIGPLSQPPFPTDRFHVALPGGRAYVAALARRCRRLGVDIRAGMKVEFLVKDGRRIAGVEARDEGGKFHMFLAARAVILATGDFSADPRLRNQIVGAGLEAIAPMNPTATGDGHRMALTVGARLARDPVMRAEHLPQARFAPPARRSLWAALPPRRPFTWLLKMAMRLLPDRLLRPIVLGAAMTYLAPERALYEQGAVLVNRAGERFTDETGPTAVLDLSHQPKGEAFVIFDETLARRFSGWPHFVSTAPGVAYAYVDDYRRVRPDLCRIDASLTGLAARLSLPPDKLAAAVAGAPASRPRLSQPPFYALGPLKAWLPLIAVGLAVDDRLRVLNTDNQPIPGLYAVGLVGQGGLMSIYHGHSLGWAFTSGRLAARHAAGQ